MCARLSPSALELGRMQMITFVALARNLSDLAGKVAAKTGG